MSLPDPLTRAARKWCRQHGEWPVEGFNGCDERIILAACREVLEEVNKEWVNRLSVYNADKAIPLEDIAAALRALRDS